MASRVLIVDDDPRFRALARTLLEAAGYEVAGEAADVASALAAAERVRPDAALVDVQLPDGDGVALGGTLAHRGARILLTSTDPSMVAAGLAFVPKDELAVTDIRRWL